MLESTKRGAKFKSGDVVYIRCRVDGFDSILPQSEACILVPIHKDGRPCAHDGWRYYANPEWLVEGHVVKGEIGA